MRAGVPVPGRLELEECLSKEYAACVPVASSPRAAFYGFDLFVTFYAACFLPSCLQCLCPASWRGLAVFFGYGLFVSFYIACFLASASSPSLLLPRRWDG